MNYCLPGIVMQTKQFLFFSSTDGNVSRLCASFLYKAPEKDTSCIVEPPLSFKYHFVSVI